MTFKKLIEGKNVIIIGPAPYLRESKISNILSDFDTVIRVNSGIDLTIKIPNVVGRRTDVVYTTADVDSSTGTNHRKVDLWIKKKIKHVRIAPPPIRPYYKRNIEEFKKSNNNRLNYSIIGEDKYLNYFEKCGNTIPNTGFCAILDCLELNPEKVHLSGITFFKGGYLGEYGVTTKTEKDVRDLFESTGNHNIDNQIVHFKSVYRNTGLISCDKFIEDVLEL